MKIHICITVSKEALEKLDRQACKENRTRSNYIEKWAMTLPKE